MTVSLVRVQYPNKLNNIVNANFKSRKPSVSKFMFLATELGFLL